MCSSFRSPHYVQLQQINVRDVILCCFLQFIVHCVVAIYVILVLHHIFKRNCRSKRSGNFVQNLRAADPRASNIDITVTDITDEITDPLANEMILSYGL